MGNATTPRRTMALCTVILLSGLLLIVALAEFFRPLLTCTAGCGGPW